MDGITEIEKIQLTVGSAIEFSQKNDVCLSAFQEVRSFLNFSKDSNDEKLVIKALEICNEVENKYGTESAISILTDAIESVRRLDVDSHTLYEFVESVDAESSTYAELKNYTKSKAIFKSKR